MSKRQKKRLLVGLAIVTVIIAGTVLAIYATVGRRRAKELQAAIRKAENHGIPTTIEEIDERFSELHPSENAVHYYMEAFERIESIKATHNTGIEKWLPIVGTAKVPENPSAPLPAKMLHFMRKYIERYEPVHLLT